jgi:hypothetical protein
MNEIPLTGNEFETIERTLQRARRFVELTRSYLIDTLTADDPETPIDYLDVITADLSRVWSDLDGAEERRFPANISGIRLRTPLAVTPPRDADRRKAVCAMNAKVKRGRRTRMHARKGGA